MSSTPLFRAQALAYATVRQYGSIVLLRPRGLAWLTAAFCLIAAGVLVFFATVDYTDKEQATGVLVPTQAPVRVQAPQAGVVDQVRVTAGQAVREGDVLFVLARPGAGAREPALVRAPQAGEVGEVAVLPGQPVAAQQALAELTPAGARLQAELHVSARAAAFARPGMPVQIRYHAYPFQRFGQFSGVVSEVSRSPLADGASGSTEALYRVRVTLARQDVPDHDGARPLMAGMGLDASLRLETRKLYESLLGPSPAADTKD